MLSAWLFSYFLLLVGCQGTASSETTSQPEDSLTHSSLPSPSPEDSIERPDIPLKYLLGHINPAEDSNFAAVQPQHGVKGSFLHREAYEAFIRMYNAARADGVTLTIISATRNFDRQKWIWENKWKGGRKVAGKNLALEVPDTVERARLILTYSSMPGTSRHHWGTDMDLNRDNNAYFASGEGLKIYQWLTTHAHEYGFCQPYSEKGQERPYGYEEEKWHWSYLPVASKYLAAYQQKVSYQTLGGFLGAGTAEELKVIDRYVAGISRACQ